MAWAEKMPSGRYRGGYRDTAGTKQHVTDDGRGFERKSDAKEAAEEAAVRARRRASVTKGTLSASITWGEWWDLLKEKRTFTDTDTGTTEHYIVEKFLRPRWGKEPMNKIGFPAVKRWALEEDLKVRPGMSPGYVHRIFSVFNVSMRAATQADPPLLELNPCLGVRLPKRPNRAKPYLATATLEKMAPKLRGDYRDALEFNLETGLRPGEICGLHADRLDLDRGWMLVAEAFVKRLRVVRPFPKDKDARMVPLTDKAIEVLRRRLAGRDLTAGCGTPHSDGSTCHSPLVFLTDRRRIMHPDTIGWHMHEAARKTGAERRSPYSARRGWATRAAEGGLDAFQIAEILGHETLTQAQGYVQQTNAARMKLSAALASYPQLVVLEGGVGHDVPRGAKGGADPDRQPSGETAIQSTENTG